MSDSRYNGFRRIYGLHRSGDSVTGTFTVLRSDHRGRGVLDLFCGSVGNATATFVVR